MQIYNTLKRSKEEFVPINGNNVTMYMCGPTVYDYFHIGNGRSFIMADVLRRYLEYKGYNVKFVMNLTDVDDKIIKKSNQENLSSDKVAEKYITAFMEDIKKLKIKTADVYPKATEHMGEIIDIIKVLEEKGFAYNVDGNVFYNVRNFSGYGKLSGKNIDDLESGARVEINDEKNNPLDFALWKKAKPEEPYWESPWGNGRPGWHIECSAMSMKHLGQNIDIHMGGSDLIFPHHENEIAQSEACSGKFFVNYWIHFGFLNIDNEKMSKSLGNFFTARDIIKKYSAETLRFFFCQSNYGNPLNFSEELIQSANSGLQKIINVAELLFNAIQNPVAEGIKPELNVSDYYRRFEESMDDDFNSPRAMAVIFDFIKNFNKVVSENNQLSAEFYNECYQFLQKTAEGVFGIIDFESFGRTNSVSLENELIDLLIKIRTEAKIQKNYALSDLIRIELKNLGIELMDSKTGTSYKKNIT